MKILATSTTITITIIISIIPFESLQTTPTIQYRNNQSQLEQTAVENVF